MRTSVASRRLALLSAASILSLTSTSAFAQALSGYQDEGIEQVVANHEVTPGTGSPTTGANFGNSPDLLASGINGVGQQIAFIANPTQTGAGLSLCTGSLINPRTVITAAHCLYNSPAHMYGSVTGTGGGILAGTALAGVYGTTNGIPLSFGFSSTNRCLGVAVNGCATGTGAYERWRDSNFSTNTALAIYNANQVWYNRGSQPTSLGGGGEFANGDIALVTLDTHAKDVPTWTLLFSPLDGPTHVTITGYGGTGVGVSPIGSLAGIDYRRRAAENMIDALMSWHDQNTTDAIAGPTSTTRIAHQHAIYWMDFDDPNWDPNNLPANFFTNTAPACVPPTAPPTAANGYCGRNNGYYDFNVLGGPTGTALPNEGSTAGGDSGGPLIVDQRWDRQVIAGVLTGSISYNGGISTYGQMNVYPPLFQFWEEIVQNNPYKYASALAGNGDWFDPAHWVQDMDPNYVVIGADGQLVNALPSTAQGGADGTTSKFGTVCFVNLYCNDITGEPYTPWGGTSLVTAGGPGSTNFVPNNVEPVNSATPGATVVARYYDVTLRQAGTTSLSQAATIDKLTIDGVAKLDIASTGNLGVWAEYNQLSGWTNVDGALKTDEALVVSGLLTGNGLFDPTYLTVVGGMVAPGGNGLGTLTVQGDVILASASALNISVAPEFSDKLLVTADPAAGTTGVLALSGGSVIFTRASGVQTPKYGGTWVIASAQGGVNGTFGSATAGDGVVKVKLTYTPNDVIASLSASSFSSILVNPTGTQLAFANALDQLRNSSSTALWGLYGNIDWVGGAQVAATFDALTPRIVGDVGALHDRQSKLLLGNVSNRFSLLASGRAQGLTMVGNVASALAAHTDGVQSGKLGFGAGNGESATIAKLPGRMTGFISGGVDRTASSYGGNQLYASQGGWHMAMGLEMPLGQDGTFGTTAGIAEGESTPNGDSNRSRTTMAAAYAAMPLGKGFYVGGLLSAESSRASMGRMSTDGSAAFRLTGATRATRYSAVAEAGFTTGIGGGLSLTPRAQLGYSRYNLGGFTEEGGDTALRLDDVTVSRLEARLGAKLEGRARIAGVTFVPQVSADYVSLLSGRETGATVRFAGAPDEAFHLPLAISAAGWAEVGGGVTLGDGPVTLGLSGQYATGGNMVDQRGQAELRFRF